MLRVIHLCKRFGTVQAVEEVSFEAGAGEVVGLLGPNGAGKTTTMRLMAGFLLPDTGEVWVNGICVQRDAIAAQQHIGYLPENAPLYREMETVAYLRFIGAMRGLCGVSLEDRLDAVIAEIALEQAVGRCIGRLSKGYRQRVALAASIIHEPQLLILDEPTSGLDPHQIIETRALIRNIGHKRTVVLSTHILPEVEAVCSRALVIHRGRLVAQGSTADLTAGGKTLEQVFVECTR